MIRVSPVWYFLLVSPPLLWMRVALAAAVIVSATTVWLNPRDVDSALGSILLLQMFSASGGYAAAASRGYYDPLLTGRCSRRRIAAANLVAAALPGGLAWCVVALVAATLGQTHAVLAPQRLVAFATVSLVAWAAGVALPRMAAGVLWASVLLSLALSRTGLGDYLTVVQSVPEGPRAVGASAIAFLICPFLLLGEFAAARNAAVLTTVASMVIVLTSLAFAYVRQRDYTLVEPL
jgi:hypothetical protein